MLFFLKEILVFDFWKELCFDWLKFECLFVLVGGFDIVVCCCWGGLGIGLVFLVIGFVVFLVILGVCLVFICVGSFIFIDCLRFGVFKIWFNFLVLVFLG